MNDRLMEGISVGTRIRILHMEGEDDSYDGRIGTVLSIDGVGQLHGTWGSLAVIPELDSFQVVGSKEAR